LSVARTRLVCQDHLAELAARLELGASLRLSRTVARSGPVHAQPSVLADGIEALIGAVFLDGGYAAATALVQRLFGESASLLSLGPLAKDPKTQLQEWLHARGWAIPEYVLLATEGPPNAPVFRAECRAGQPPIAANAIGRSRKAAEQAAAALILEHFHRRGIHE
jgi:ribonuclease-3